MSKSKHTPGPWTLEPNGPGYNLKSPDRTSHFCILLGMNGQPDGEHEANARLIAAAPELLEACNEAEVALRDLADFYVGHLDHNLSFAAGIEIVRRAVRAAIAKAEDA